MGMLSQSLNRIGDELQQLKQYLTNKHIVYRWRQEVIRGTAGHMNGYLVPHEVINAQTDVTLYELRFEGLNYRHMRLRFDNMHERLVRYISEDAFLES